MSMRDYAVDTYGLLLDGKAMRALAKKICDGYTDDNYNKELRMNSVALII